MKSITKLSFLAAITTVLASSSAFADNQQMTNQLALQRAHDGQPSRVTTVAVYSDDRGVGSSMRGESQTETRFEFRTNAHGDRFGVYAPVR